MNTTDAPAIDLRGVSMRFGAVDVLRAIDLRIAGGQDHVALSLPVAAAGQGYATQ